MKRIVHFFAGLVVLAAIAPAVQAQGSQPVPYQEGLHYFLIEGAPAVTTGPTEVVEAFSYMCSHCNAFEPYLNAWKKRKPESVKFSRLPVVFGRSSWELYARAYITADMLDVADKAHTALMDRLWKEKKIMRDMEELAEFYSQFGVDPQKFVATSKSFAVDTRLKKDQLLVQNYGVMGTPSLIVNGKFRVAGNAAVPSFEAMLDVVNFLVTREGAASGQDSATGN
jgi:thiol:disulfide interchange protein DsbA